LGSSSAVPAFDRHQSAQLFTLHNNSFLIDCGEGTQQQMARFKAKPSKLKRIFISHLHGDHYLGLVGLLSSLHLMHRMAPLELYGPPGLAEILTLQFKHSATTLRYPLHFHALSPDSPERIVDDEYITVDTIPLEHRVPTTGFLFTEKPKPYSIRKDIPLPKLTRLQALALKRGQDVYNEQGQVLLRHQDYTRPPKPQRSYAYCSDTRLTHRILPQIQGIDLLYHEATFLHADAQRAAQTFHTTALQAAQLAQKAGVKRLLLGHFSIRYKDLSPLLKEAQTVFANTALAQEGVLFEVAETPVP